MTSEAWRPGQVIDIDTEDGMEFGAEILGPSKDGDAKEMQIKFRDGVVDDWPIAEFIRRESDPSAECVVIIGGGVIGLSCCAAIAKRGCQVTLLDDSTAATVRSSRGDTRSLHFGYEGVYSDMVTQSADMWRALQERDAKDKKRKVLHNCGSLTFGSRDDIEAMLATHSRNGRRGANNVHQLEVLDPCAISKRWQHISADEANTHAIFDGDGFEIDMNCACELLSEEARANGAKIKREEEVTKIDRRTKMVTTSKGQSYKYTQLVLACGPWTNRVLSMAMLPKLPLFVSNEQSIYVKTPPVDKASGSHPSPFSIQERAYSYSDGERNYACPVVGCFRVLKDGPWDQTAGKPCYCSMVPVTNATGKSLPVGDANCVRLQVHQQGELLQTEQFVLKPGSSTDEFVASAFHRREFVKVHDKGTDWWQTGVVTGFVESHLPTLAEGLNEPELTYRTLCTSTADNHFVCGDHPMDDSVIVATGMHGEDFCFAPSIATLCANFVTKSPIDPIMNSCFTPHRFFLDEKLLAAFGGSGGSLPRERAAAVVRMVYGDMLEWDDVRNLCRIITDGGKGHFGYEELKELLPIEELRMQFSQRHSLGPMQKSRAAAVVTGDALAITAAATIKTIYRVAINALLYSLFLGYIVLGIVLLVLVVTSDETLEATEGPASGSLGGATMIQVPDSQAQNLVSGWAAALGISDKWSRHCFVSMGIFLIMLG